MMARWAEKETETVDLGDGRLDSRMATMLSALGDRPHLSIPAACQGRAEMEAAYRFFDNAKVTFDKVLAPHSTHTLERLAAQRVVLLVQDTTEIDLTHLHMVGVGVLDEARRGFLMHALHAFTPEGLPLGTAWAEIVNRTAVTHAAQKTRLERARTPIEAKESMRWLQSLRQSRSIAEQFPAVQCIAVADSEADIYEWLAEPRGESLHWVVRACQERALANEPGSSLRAEVLASRVLYRVSLRVRSRKAKTAAEDRARRRNRRSRQAKVEARASTVTLRPPKRADRRLEPVTVNVVLVREPNPPAGETPVEWVLLTTLPIQTLEQVKSVVGYYTVRWGVEVLFRTLKSGCRVEERRFEHVDRALPCLALYLIVAWRTLFVCHLGRCYPELDCEVVFQPSEWQALWMAIHRRRPPKKKPRLVTIVHLAASLGGYVERPNGEPGAQTLWIGLQRMHDLAWAWDTFGPGAKPS